MTHSQLCASERLHTDFRAKSHAELRCAMHMHAQNRPAEAVFTNSNEAICIFEIS